MWCQQHGGIGAGNLSIQFAHPDEGQANQVARQIVTETVVTDDIDGSPATETVAFSIDGTAYEIDLNKSNRKAFDKAMALYVGHARKARGSRTTTRAGRGRGAEGNLICRRQCADIRSSPTKVGG